MALSEDIDEESIPDEIRELVIDLNRIHGLNTYTSKNSSVDRKNINAPTVDGCISFGTKTCTNSGLIVIIREFCNPPFSITKPELDIFYESWLKYSIDAESLPYQKEMSNTLMHMTAAERIEFYEKAEQRQEEINKGWFVLSLKVKEYIRSNISADIESLPYRNGFIMPRRSC
jgi:hypothetical protein